MTLAVAVLTNLASRHAGEPRPIAAHSNHGMVRSLCLPKSWRWYRYVKHLLGIPAFSTLASIRVGAEQQKYYCHRPAARSRGRAWHARLIIDAAVCNDAELCVT